MTSGQVLEGIMGKSMCLDPKTNLKNPTVNGIAFGQREYESLMKVMHAKGRVATGVEVLYDGMTGERLDGVVSVVIVHFQRLRHQVDDKKHCRSTGPINVLTRQPTEGRARDGGLRMGEMFFFLTLSTWIRVPQTTTVLNLLCVYRCSVASRHSVITYCVLSYIQCHCVTVYYVYLICYNVRWVTIINCNHHGPINIQFSFNKEYLFSSPVFTFGDFKILLR